MRRTCPLCSEEVRLLHTANAALSPVRTNRYEYADGHRTWQVSLYQRGPIEVNFSVTIDIGTGMVLDISHWCGGNG